MIRLRLLLAKLLPAVFILGALAGFWFLSHGMSVGPSAVVGYAEERVHNVSSLQSGRLQLIHVSVGQSVRKGDVLAHLDATVLRLERSRLEAALTQARAQLLADEDIERAQLQRSQLQAVRAFATEQRSRAELREVTKQVVRLEALAAQKLVRANEVEAARQRQRALAADLATRPTGSVQSLALVGTRPRTQVDQAQRLQDRLAPQRATILEREAVLAQLENSLNELVLRAPIDGTVGAILHQVGDVVGPLLPVVTLVTARPGHIVAFVSERRGRNLQLGSPVSLRRVGVFGAHLPAHITELAPLLEEPPTRLAVWISRPAFVRRIVVSLDSPQPLLPGETFHILLP